MDLSLPPTEVPARFHRLYRRADLHETGALLLVKPLFQRHKAAGRSHDGASLYDLARDWPGEMNRLHRELAQGTFEFRPALPVHKNLNGKRRVFHIFPWRERLVDLLLYRLLNRYFHSRFHPASYAYRHAGYGLDLCQRRLARLIRSRSRPVQVLKRDVRDFFPSIQHGLLLDLLREWIAPEDPLAGLLEQCVRFRIQEGEEVRVADRGVAFGTATACFLANVYLTPLDFALEKVSGVRVFRYADDWLLLSQEAGRLEQAREILDNGLKQLGLEAKPTHSLDFTLAAAPAPSRAPSGALPLTDCRDRFRHLGLEFRADGSIGLSRDKFRKLRNQFRFAFRRHAGRFKAKEAPEERARLAIALSREVLERPARPVAVIDYYLKHVTDEDQLRRLDRWLAEEVLHRAYGSGHRKGHFRRMPYRQLRAWGLPSLVHRHRRLRHGDLVSPFFCWKTPQPNRQERRRSPSNRHRPAGFPSHPEAAASVAPGPPW